MSAFPITSFCKPRHLLSVSSLLIASTRRQDVSYHPCPPSPKPIRCPRPGISLPRTQTEPTASLASLCCAHAPLRCVSTAQREHSCAHAPVLCSRTSLWWVPACVSHLWYAPDRPRVSEIYLDYRSETRPGRLFKIGIDTSN